MSKDNDTDAPEQTSSDNSAVNNGEAFTKIVEVLQSVDETKPDAKLNETSMSDNNDRRIKFNDGVPRNADELRAYNEKLRAYRQKKKP